MTYSKLSNRFMVLGPGLLLALLAAYCFHTILQHHWPDLYDHVLLYQGPWDEKVKSHILLFLLLKLASLGSTETATVFNALIGLLVIAVLARYALLVRYLAGPLKDNQRWMAILAFCLCVVHPFPYRYPQMYLGQISGNSWHNSTVILLVPLALMQFFDACRLLERYDRKISWRLALLALAGCLAKPNFFLVYLLCFPLMLLWQRKPKTLAAAVPYLFHLLPAILLLGWQFGILFLGPARGDSAIAFTPFLVWDHFVTSKLLALFTSIAFPLAFVLIYGLGSLKCRQLGFAWLLFGAGLLLFILLSEQGPRQFHGNFMWQLVPCTLILFAVTLSEFLGKLNAENNSIFRVRNIFLLGLFLLHAASGMAYILKIPRAGIW